MDARGPEKVFAGKSPLRRIQERDQQRIAALGQIDPGPGRIGQGSQAVVQHPSAEAGAMVIAEALSLRPYSQPPSQHRPDPGDEFALGDGVGDAIVRTELIVLKKSSLLAV